VAVDSGAETRTCVSIADRSRSDLTELYADMPQLAPEALTDFASAVTTALEGSAGWLSFSGRAPGPAADTLAELVSAGHQARHKVAVDTHSEALPAAVERSPELVKVNRGEAAELLGYPEDGDLAEMATAISRRSGGMVVLTDGAAGAVGCDGSRVLLARGPGVRGSYPVGSGDAFLGGLVAALDQGADLADGLTQGMACGTANALIPGPGRLDRSTAYALAREITLTDV
jgi:fructose-1-phosphate kinase PfkB-like protein